MFEIRKYTAELRDDWNLFVARSKNGTFLFDRNYMEYHRQRFADFSLLFYLKGRPYALLPANREGNTLLSHAGLTYGGLVMDAQTTAANTVRLFEELNAWLRAQGFEKVVYKCIPWIYHRMAAEEDLYAIFRTCRARLAARDFGSVITHGCEQRWQRIRRRAVGRADELGVVVRQTNDFAGFWDILTENLSTKYGVLPVHDLAEINLLHSRFPNHIKLYTATADDELLGGVVLYLTPQVAHAQYSSATKKGKQWGAIDKIYSQIIPEQLAECRYFDFGRSTENRGLYLNEKLIFQKEGYGARGLCWDWYEWNL